MKIEQLLVQHLYTAKQVRLEGIGTIHLDPAVILPAETEKDYQMPENAFRFEYDPKAAVDDALVDFIVHHTRKIKPLAHADLESYSSLAKQFLNIGKPLVIEGVGTILKDQPGSYSFTPGHFIHTKIEEAPQPLREKISEPVHHDKQDSGRSKAWLVWILILLLLAGGGYSIYYVLTNNRQTDSKPQSAEITTDSSTLKREASPDTVSAGSKTDSSSLKQQTAAATDSFTFRVVIKSYKTEAAAQKAFSNLTQYGHHVELYHLDSSHIFLRMPFKRPLSDTTAVRDSLRRFFGGNPFIHLNK